MSKHFSITHPSFDFNVKIDSITVAFTQAKLDGKRDPISILKKLTSELHLAWPENAKERDFILGLDEEAREVHMQKWSDYITMGVDAIAAVLDDKSPCNMSQKIAANLLKVGLDAVAMKFQVVGTKMVVAAERRYKPKSGRLESIPVQKDFGVDDARSYDIFDGELPSHNEAKSYYVPHVAKITDPECSYIRDTEGYKNGNMDGVLNALKQHRTYRDSDDKKYFRSLVTKNHEPEDVLASAKELIEANVSNVYLKNLELDELKNAGPFDRYPVEYWFHKLFSSYEPKDTTFDFTVYNNAWKIVARMIKKTICEHDAEVKKNFPNLAHQRAKLFGPDDARTSRLRKRETSNAGFPSFSKFLGDEWEEFIDEAEAIAANPSKYDPTKYDMIVGNRVIGKNLHIPENATEDEVFDYISAKNKQRVIQMGSGVEFIIGSRFTHPLLRVLSTRCEAFKGLKSWMGVRGDIGTRIARHKLGSEPLAMAFGADASNFDASITIFDWVQVKRLFQIVFPGHEDLVEWYFTLCAFSPTITLDENRQAVQVSGCSGMASGVACTAMVDSIVELVRAVAVAIETDMIENNALASIPADLGIYVCGDDMGYLVGQKTFNGKLTAESFSKLYAKYGGTAHADKQLVTTPDHELGITLLFLKRLFSERTDVGFGTRLIANTVNGLIYTNPSDFTSANRVLEGFMKYQTSEDELETMVYNCIAESDVMKNVAEGNLSANPEDIMRAMKKQAEANKKAKALLESVDEGNYEELERVCSDSTILWTTRVSNVDSLSRFVELGIITEDEMLAQMEKSTGMVPFDLAKLHLIKVVQQVEENHPHPAFKSFVNWAFNMNPEFFNYKLLEGDEAQRMAQYMRGHVEVNPTAKEGDKGRGIATWKVMPLLRDLCAGEMVDLNSYPTKAALLECLIAEKRTVTYMSSLLNCLGMPFDTILENIRLLLKELDVQKRMYLSARCDNEVSRVAYIRAEVLSFKHVVNRARVTANLTEMSAAVRGMEGFDLDLRDVYSSVKKNALTRETASEASVSSENA